MSTGRITLDNLSIAYDRHIAVRGIRGEFASGSMTAVCGPNGAGKSTLAKALVGVLSPSGGQIRRAGLQARDIAYLPQAADIDRSFPITVADTVLLGAWRRLGPFRGAGRETAQQAAAALATVGLDGFGSRPIGALSAGQFQRVLFARLLLQDASVIVLDEPFNAVDARTARDLLGLVRGWHGEKRTVIAVLHDFDLVRAHFPETLLMARDQIAWGPTAQVLDDANLRAARARAESWADETAALAA